MSQAMNTPRHPVLLSPTAAGDIMTAPLLATCTADINRPNGCTRATAALLDFWLPWLGYLGLGIALQDFVLGSYVAGVSAVCGLLFQAYQYHVQKTLRVWPKVNPLVLSLTWMGNAVFALLTPKGTVTRYTLFVVISGALFGNALSLAMGRPVLLEEAMEEVWSRARPDGPPHPLFVQMYTRASYALLALTCVQWPSFLLTAFFFYGDPVLAPILLLAVPVGSLLITVVGIAIYLWRQKQLLRTELEREAQLKPGGLIAQYTNL